MKIGPGEQGNMHLPVGEEAVFSHNKPVTFRVVTAGGSVIEVELPGGTEFKVKSAGDISSVTVSIYDSPNGPLELV